MGWVGCDSMQRTAELAMGRMEVTCGRLLHLGFPQFPRTRAAVSGTELSAETVRGNVVSSDTTLWIAGREIQDQQLSQIVYVKAQWVKIHFRYLSHGFYQNIRGPKWLWLRYGYCWIREIRPKPVEGAQRWAYYTLVVLIPRISADGSLHEALVFLELDELCISLECFLVIRRVGDTCDVFERLGPVNPHDPNSYEELRDPLLFRKQRLPYFIPESDSVIKPLREWCTVRPK
ncbi:hypothetical protein BDY21DRAFT_46653 [Lineolata rhizophorae]|uniref:Uncharacterized protein n=1 Tax=Lineolata rhizophorae TaxID=578093 RepID=A0A6A6NZH3_9PEZI|nr:hypothetical protein BDY21DRAFT_46653 [Lineolata rhizophorae]